MKSISSRLVSTPTSDKAGSPCGKKLHQDMDGFTGFIGANHSCSFELENPIMAMETKSETNKNPIFGYLFMLISVFGITLGHISSKLVFTHNPELNNFDCVTFFGIWLTTVYFGWAQASKVSLKLNDMPKKPFIALVCSILVTIVTQMLLFKGISLISVGKSTLIFSTNPMFSMFLATVFLGEKLEKSVIALTFVAFIGIYFLSQKQR